ncbi:MAG: hypothetical protein JWP25_6544 [Bradyrhizobium sp.]|nr:hypothetical protein [Bradyrhizobium sp.]
MRAYYAQHIKVDASAATAVPVRQRKVTPYVEIACQDNWRARHSNNPY